MTTHKQRWLSAIPALALALSLVPSGIGSSLAQGDSATFPETGKTVKGKFLTYWRANGGLAQQGFPISEEMSDRSDTDGKIYTMQYFERAVFELHPENAAPNDVLLSLLGNFGYKAKYGAAGAPNQKASTTNATKFAQTGKTLGGRFREYWEANGGLRQQGFPISDEFQEKSDLDGKTYTVQYFERAVFEAHPENQRPFDVLLSQLGTFELRKQAAEIAYPEGAGSVTLWHGYTGSEAATLTKAVSMLSQKNANFKVTLLAVPFDQLKNKFTTEASTGGGPDLLIGPSDWVGEFADAKLVAELTGDSVAGIAAILPSALNVARFDNKLWGIPTSIKNVALFYNKTLVKTLPKNTDELLTMSGALVAGNVKYGAALNAGFYHAVGYNFAFGGKIFNNPKQADLNTAGTIAWLNWLKKAKNSKGVFVKAGADDDINNLFKTGQAAMIINGPWALEDYEKTLGANNVGVAIAPSTPTGGKFAPFVGSENFYLNANKKDNKAAIDFLAYISSAGVQTLFVREAGQISTNQKVDVGGANKNLVPFVQQAAQGSVFPNFPAMGQVWTPAGDMITKVLDGKSTPEQAAKEATDAINKAIQGGY